MFTVSSSIPVNNSTKIIPYWIDIKYGKVLL